MTDARPDWSRLSPAERQARWTALVGWVTWLQDTYEAWVKLPECWPRHEALRRELEFFRAWHQDIEDDGTDPYDGTNWHASLRSAALAWQDLANCRHEAEPWRHADRLESELFRQHLKVAMEATAVNPQARLDRVKQFLATRRSSGDRLRTVDDA
jgi:hypothetical protein